MGLNTRLSPPHKLSQTEVKILCSPYQVSFILNFNFKILLSFHSVLPSFHTFSVTQGFPLMTFSLLELL